MATKVAPAMALPLSFMCVADDEQAEALDRRGAYTDMTRAGTRAWPAKQGALLTREDDDGAFIFEVGSVTRSHVRVATGWHRIRYVRRLEFEPLALAELLAAIPARLRATVEWRATSGGAVPPKSAEAVLAALDTLRPAAARELRRVLGTQGRRARGLRGAALQAAAQEADAVRLALDIADIPRRELRDARPDGEMPFLAQLQELRASEDTTVAYDSMRFLDFDRLESPSGAVVFTRGYERLTVINVNRQPLEKTTGADLIYINETIPTFVLVQYKSLRREGDNPPRLIYRPDKQLETELKRMRELKTGVDDGTPAGFRLHTSACFLKLCKPVTNLDRGQDLVGGMYLPLPYYDVLIQSGDVRGPRGGIVLSRETIKRYVDNALFVALVRGGWVGSRGATTQQLTKLVLSGLAADRSMTVAAAWESDEYEF